MFGLSSKIKDALNATVEDMFDRIALDFIGEIPALKNTKRLVISDQPNFGLPHLFVQAMGNKVPNEIERDMLRSLLESSHGYIASLKNRTRANITERIDGLSREATLRNEKMSQKDVQDVLAEEMGKAKSHLIAIVESESTKLRNLGSMMDISRKAGGIGDTDPTVFFVVIRDGVTCKECIRLHLMPDQITPRLWKFSELKQGYHKRGEEKPSAFGLHPHCRCTLTYLSQGFGFDESGRVEYKSESYNAYKRQK
jgi:hypothetical protein